MAWTGVLSEEIEPFADEGYDDVPAPDRAVAASLVLAAVLVLAAALLFASGALPRALTSVRWRGGSTAVRAAVSPDPQGFGHAGQRP